jgi:hypothetical protein
MRWLNALLVSVMAMPVGAQVLPGPGLGGSPAAFEQLLGGPNDASIGAQLHYQRCAGTDIDQFVLLAPNDQVWTIQREWCELGTVAADRRFADAAQFLPADALPGDAFTTERGEPAQSWLSPSLANTLPAGLFHDCTGKSVAPGTLFVVADSFGGWFMGPGTCPSQ